MDLDAEVQARHGRKLLDLIEMLPSASRTREAILNDPEEAALLAALPEPDDEWAPRISEWTLPVALQYDQRAILVAILRTLEVQVTGKRAKPVLPLPPPRTAVDKAREAIRRERIEELKYAFGYRPR
ncbi:MAG TPA: hypothetical protein VFL73_02805 [Solirubrobacteraceae bacterium]|nr:hypothetical protein [Solirubrobacteraceae bacterium]